MKQKDNSNNQNFRKQENDFRKKESNVGYKESNTPELVEKKKNVLTKVSNETGNSIKYTLYKGAEVSKDSLNKSDFEGVKVATNSVNSSLKLSSKSSKIIQEKKAVQRQVQQKFKQKESLLKKESEGIQEKISSNQSVSEKLEKELESDKKELSKLSSKKGSSIKDKIEEKNKIIQKKEQRLSSLAKDTINSEKVLKKKEIELSNLNKKRIKKGVQRKNALKKVSSAPISFTKKSTNNYIKSLESEESEGVKVVNQSALALSKAIKKLNKGSIKQKNSKNKLNKQSSKLKNANSKFVKKEVSKGKQIEKQKMRKSMYTKKSRQLAKQSNKYFSTNVLSRFVNFFKDGKFSIRALKSFVSGKIALLIGGGSGILLPFIITGALIMLVVGFLGASTTPNYVEQSSGGGKALSPQVERYRDLVTKIAKEEGMSEYVDLALALIQVESGGNGNDIMQSSESAGFPPNYFTTPTDSVRQGFKHMKQIVNILKAYKKDYEKNTKLIAQAYNYGVAFASYVGNRGGEYSLQVSEDYSKNVVAPSLGNTSGQTYSYVNEISKSLGKTYLYLNGGNFMYGDMVNQYIGMPQGNGDYALPVDNPNISSPFGYRDWSIGGGGEFHRGLDFANPYGSSIKAIQSGVVITAEYHYSWGNHVVIQHPDGKVSLYAHQSVIKVKRGDTVQKGQVIGEIGSTGDSTGPHLHLEIAKSADLSQGNLLDPAIVLGIK